MSAAGSVNSAARAGRPGGASSTVVELTSKAPADSVPVPEPGSYRDRNGGVFYRDGEVYRGISARALANWERLATTRFFRDYAGRGNIVRTERVNDAIAAGAPWAAVLKHEPVPFVSYPYEWTFGMLKDAALLHLDLMLAALEEGFILKDSSAYNIQWRGAKPVFIDIPSFEVHEEGEPWVGYRQFCELFLYPLMLQAYKGADFRPWLRGSLDGMSAGALRPLLSTRDLLRPGVMMHVVAQDALQRRYSGQDRNVRSTLAQAGFDRSLIVRNVRNLRKIVSGMKAGGGKTEWADYASTHSYGEADFDAKCGFVREAAGHRRWRRVWDIGCNTGTFSRITAEHADHVVAMDGDWMAIEALYQAQKERPDAGLILPLVVNLSNPSPGQGWRGTERKPLTERGRPELTLCLALIHHMVISANIPMADFIRWLAGLGTALVIEFVGREDEMVQTLLRNKDDQYDDYRLDVFERLLAEHFDIRESRPLKGGKRSIYFALPMS
ncbi:MAG: class I SAM-dependent methyltransferase [Rhizobiaceae bacterium]|nr:class I SAM-dependent methyltransferase [Rhizobiaceae bacterium]MCV0405250.1 class I SAM-dependent methyltransferase [Rhizobiaceae bacterium]